MLRFLSWLLSLPFVITALIFALANRGEVALSFWPFDATITLPLSILILGLLILGVGMGLTLGFVGGLGKRLEARHLRKALLKLQEDTKIIPPSPTPPIATMRGGIGNQPPSSPQRPEPQGHRLSRLSPFSKQSLFAFRKPTI